MGGQQRKRGTSLPSLRSFDLYRPVFEHGFLFMLPDSPIGCFQMTYDCLSTKSEVKLARSQELGWVPTPGTVRDKDVEAEHPWMGSPRVLKQNLPRACLSHSMRSDLSIFL